MTPTEINRGIARYGRVLLAWNNLAALAEAAQLASEQLPVKWVFEPGVPATAVDYLAGGAGGAVKGATFGIGVELLLAAVFPGVAFGYAVLGGALLGAASGVRRVDQGWHVKFLYAFDGAPLLEVRRAA